MYRVTIDERPDWRRSAEECGFVYHTIDGLPYWDESAYYEFTLQQIEHDLEDPSAELHAMSLEIVDRAVRDEEIMQRLAIPESAWDLVRESYRRRDPSLYGRFDFAYDGLKPAKLLEYNADTPTALYEAACFQWAWLEEQIARGALPTGTDQFNSIHDKLVAAIGAMAGGRKLFGASMRGSTEDRGTVAYIQDCAVLAGLQTGFTAIEDIGLLESGMFCDANGEAMPLVFKLYPWEWMLRDAFAANLLITDTDFLEPVWKTILSNKGLLPLLWDLAPGHPNLLPAYFEGDPRASELGQTYVRKPLYSREGANVTLVRDGVVVDDAGGAYGAEGHIVQALAHMPCFEGNYPVIGSWIIADRPAGIGVREDRRVVTTNDSRFVPHVIRA